MCGLCECVVVLCVVVVFVVCGGCVRVVLFMCV